MKLPDEISQANWVAKERQRIISEAQAEADQVVEKAAKEREGLVDDTEIVKLANEKADKIIQNAESKAQEMKVNSVQYSDAILTKLIENIGNIHNILEQNKEELKNM